MTPRKPVQVYRVRMYIDPVADYVYLTLASSVAEAMQKVEAYVKQVVPGKRNRHVTGVELLGTLDVA